MKSILKTSVMFMFIVLLVGCSASMGKMDCYTNNNGEQSQTICH